MFVDPITQGVKNTFYGQLCRKCIVKRELKQKSEHLGTWWCRWLHWFDEKLSDLRVVPWWWSSKTKEKPHAPEIVFSLVAHKNSTHNSPYLKLYMTCTGKALQSNERIKPSLKNDCCQPNSISAMCPGSCSKRSHRVLLAFYWLKETQTFSQRVQHWNGPANSQRFVAPVHFRNCANRPRFDFGDYYFLGTGQKELITKLPAAVFWRPCNPTHGLNVF